MQRGRTQPKVTGSVAVNTTTSQATQSQPTSGSYAADQRYKTHSMQCSHATFAARVGVMHHQSMKNMLLLLRSTQTDRHALMMHHLKCSCEHDIRAMYRSMYFYSCCRHVCAFPKQVRMYTQASWVWAATTHSPSCSVQPATPTSRPYGCTATIAHGRGQWLESRLGAEALLAACLLQLLGGCDRLNGRATFASVQCWNAQVLICS